MKMINHLRIVYFYKYDETHPYFPLGIGIAKYQTIEIESMEKHFKLKDKK